MGRQLLLIMISLILLSCKDKERTLENTTLESEQYSDELKIEKSVSIPIDQNGYYQSYQTHMVESNDSIYLYRENNMKRTVDVFNWTAKEKSRSISFDGSIGGNPFLPMRGDSIFMAIMRTGDLVITENGKITSSGTPLVDENDKRVRYFTADNGIKPVRIGSKIFMFTASNIGDNDPTINNRKPLAWYDLKTEKAKLLNIRYPATFKGGCWSGYHYFVSFTKNPKNQLVISFSTDPTIYIYDPAKDSVVAQHNSEPRNYVEEVTPYHACDFNNLPGYFKYLKSVARYRAITYDKFKNVYYRLVSLPAQEPIDEQRDHDIVMPLSVMVLDDEFNVITERKLPGYTYDPKDFFITQEGLWISTANEGADDFDDDALSFSLFKLEGV